MAVRIRLARHGKKNFAFFHVIVTDSRAPRDGRFIERIGTYNPNTNPAIIELDTEKAFQWLNNGAQPSDTCRRILSYKGVLLKKHLMDGVKKGALTEEVANTKLETWLQEKEQQIASKKSSLEQESRNERKTRLQAEAKVNEAKAAALAKKRSDAAIKAAEAKAAALAEEAAEGEEPAPATEEAQA
jgi:small subunit ribosomal protein S16